MSSDKQIEEIFAEIEKYLVTGRAIYEQIIHTTGIVTFAHLKKKHTEVGNDTLKKHGR